MTPSNGTPLHVSDLSPLEQIGSGQYGFVYKATHLPTQKEIAVKKILCTRKLYNDFRKFWKFLLDGDDSKDDEFRQYIVHFYGTIFYDSDCWLCMELLDMSLEKLNRFVTKTPGEFIPEFVIAQVARSMVFALHYLESNACRVRRRSCDDVPKRRSESDSLHSSSPYADIKTANVLLGRNGTIKLCDIGMCRRLVDPQASSFGGEWFHYVAPERICPVPDEASSGLSDHRADVWAIGISLYEVATGALPFGHIHQPFQVIAAIANGPSPRLEAVEPRFSPELTSFVNSCLTKCPRERPTYLDLVTTDLVAESEPDLERLSSYFSRTIDMMAEEDEKEAKAREAERQAMCKKVKRKTSRLKKAPENRQTSVDFPIS